jgi:hypothetical protein
MRVIDTFCFFNELEVLDLRLNILDNYVDRFVLVEGVVSHQNKPKPLYYHENKHLFEKYNHKIDHIIVDDFPEHTYWSHDAYQRNCIIRGVYDKCDSDDVIFISDLDEIWNPDAIIPLLNDVENDKMYWWQSLVCYFYMNLVAQSEPWVQPFLLKYSLLKDLHDSGYFITEDLMRNLSKRCPTPRVTFENIRGWHFSYLSDPEHKLQNFTHSEYRNITNQDIQRFISQNINPFHRHNRMWTISGEDLSNYLPKIVNENLEKYAKFIKD